MKNTIDYNSSVNQEIKQKFVAREIIHRANIMIQEISQHETFYEELEAFSGYDFEQCFEESGLEVIESTGLFYIVDTRVLNSLYDSEKSDTDFFDNWLSDNCLYSYNHKPDFEEICYDLELNYDSYPLEIFEYWIVSDFLARKLKEYGQIVTDVFDFTIWGRQTTGQAILLDYVISKICEDMGILSGQKYDWSK